MDSVEERLSRLLRRLDASVVLVEGKRDAAALVLLGVTAPVVAFRRTVEGTVEAALEASAGARGVALLYDFDEEGRRKAVQMAGLLEAHCRVDAEARGAFRRLFGVRCVEEAACALERMRVEESARLKEQLANC